jgi:hypothetical protein
MISRGAARWLTLLVDGETVSELGSIVGEHGVDAIGEGGQEAGEERRGGGSLAIHEDLDIDEAGRPLDGHVGIAAPVCQLGEILHIHMDEAGRPIGLKGDRLVACWLG